MYENDGYYKMLKKKNCWYMEYSIHCMENIKLYGLSVNITKSQTKNHDIIKDFWKEFNIKLKTVNLPRKSGGHWEKYGITYKSGDIYKYFCGVPVENNYENTFFEENKIVNGNYAVFQHKGAMYYIKDTINKIYKEIIPNNKFELNQIEYFHFELYNYKFKWNNDESIIGIYVPIKGT
jgi:predicted transcriptional regulator YdeE